MLTPQNTHRPIQKEYIYTAFNLLGQIIPGLVFTNEVGKHLCYLAIGTRYKKLVKALACPTPVFMT